MSRSIEKGSTDQSTIVRILNATDGLPRTDVDADFTGLAFWYRREGGLKVAITGITDLGTLSAAHTPGGLLHVSDGYYRLDMPDAAVGANSSEVLIGGSGTGIVVLAASHPLVDDAADVLLDAENGVEMGLTMRHALQAMMAVMAGKLSGVRANTPKFFNFAGTKVRVTATVNADGRPTITYDFD